MSVRLRVALVAALAVALVLGVAGAGLVIAQDRVLIGGIDDALRQRADDLEALAREGTIPDVLADRDGDEAFAQIVDQDGHVLLASRRARDVPPLGPEVAAERLATTMVPIDDEPFRILSRPMRLEGQPVTLHVLTTLEVVVEGRVALLRALLIGLPLIVAVLAALVWWVIGRTLRPVTAIQQQVAAITGEDLHRRVPESAADDEIGRLARLMNAMLDRLERSAGAQRRFTSDAAHELRSPLARIRSELEVDRAHPDTADLARTHARVLEEAMGLQELVDDLLLLAREQAPAGRRVEPVDLRDLALDVMPALPPDVQASVVGQPTTAMVDRSRVGRCIRNLLDNAVRHADSRVEVQVGADGPDAVVAVVDDGPGIPPDRHEEVFQRFSRLDEARAADDGGVGLGLAIARQLAESNGGSLILDPAHLAGARFVLRVPLEPLS